MPYAITQCYLPSDRGDIPACTPRSKAGTRLSDPGWMLQVKNSLIRPAVLIQYRRVTDRQTHVILLTGYRPWGGETICPRRWQFDLKIAADLRPSGDGSAHLRWRVVAKLQAASVPIA